MAIAAIGFMSCDDDGLNREKDVEETSVKIQYNTSSVTTIPTCIIEKDIKPCFAGAIKLRCSQLTDINSAHVVFVASSQLDANSEKLNAVLSNGGAVVVVEPDMAQFKAWADKNAHSYICGDTGKYSFLGISGSEVYMLDDIFASNDVEEGSTDTVKSEEADKSEPATAYNAIPIEIGETVEYCNLKLNSLVNWLNVCVDMGDAASEDPAIPKTINELTGLIDDDNFSMRVTHSYNIEYKDYKICSTFGSDDKVTRHSTVEYAITIVPLYAFQETSAAGVGGDYYIVKAQFVGHNGEMCQLYRRWTFVAVAHAFPFYMKDMHAELTLLDNAGNEISGSNIVFWQEPVPQSTQNSTSYTSGFSGQFNFNVQGGVSGGKPGASITVGAALTWSNSHTTAMSDLGIVLNTDPNSRKVTYDFNLNNVKYDDELEKAIPAAGRSDRYDNASWCWHVKNTTDDSTTPLKLRVNIKPIYGYIYRHATWSCEGNTKTVNDQTVRCETYTLKAPDRRRTGIISLKSTNSNYLTNVKVIDAKDNVVATYTSAYEKNCQIMRQVPIGTYTLTYEVRDGDTAELLGTYKITNVVVTTANTTSKSTLDGVKI